MCPERFGRCHPQTQHMPLRPANARTRRGATRPERLFRAHAGQCHRGAGGRAIDRPGQIEAPQALTAHWGETPGPDCGRVTRFQGRPRSEGTRSSPRDRPQRKLWAPQKAGNLSVARGRRASGTSPKYLVGRPAREAKYVAPQGVFNSAQPNGRRKGATNTIEHRRYDVST
jgi:hypothetical protein